MSWRDYLAVLRCRLFGHAWGDAHPTLEGRLVHRCGRCHWVSIIGVLPPPPPRRSKPEDGSP
jgi:hypothetical protein